MKLFQMEAEVEKKNNSIDDWDAVFRND